MYSTSESKAIYRYNTNRIMAFAEDNINSQLGKRKFNEDEFAELTPTREICKRFRPIDISNIQRPNYIPITEKVNRLENDNMVLEEKVAKLIKEVSALEDKYREQNLNLKKYVDTRAEASKLSSESKDLIQKMELLTDRCKAVLAENDVLKTDIKYLEKACDKSADYYRMCFT